MAEGILSVARQASNFISLQQTRARKVARLLRSPGVGSFAQLQLDRRSAEFQRAFTSERPLISVCIATYNRSSLLAERSVASILAQTYENFELIVVGDACTDDTAGRMAAITDPRLKFYNLPERGKYPEERELRWMVAGTAPANHALSLAKGDWITHLDDDDEHDPDRLEKLLQHAQRSGKEFLWHPFQWEQSDGSWYTNQAMEFRIGQVTTSSVFYHRWFSRIGWDPHCYRYREPGDWNRFRKIKFLRAKSDRFPDALLTHYREQNQQPTRNDTGSTLSTVIQ